jgi:hypothetical protein
MNFDHLSPLFNSTAVRKFGRSKRVSGTCLLSYKGILSSS